MRKMKVNDMRRIGDEEKVLDRERGNDVMTIS